MSSKDFSDTVADVPTAAVSASPDDLVRHHFGKARRLVRQGRWLVVLALLPATAWLALAPLSTDLVAPGQINTESAARSARPAESGIVRRVLVRDGEIVRTGQPLLELQPIGAAAELRQLLSQLLALRATVFRLEAEQAGRTTLSWPLELVLAARTDAALTTQLGREEADFIGRRESIHQQTGLMRNQRTGVEQQLATLRRNLAEANTTPGAHTTDIQEELHRAEQRLSEIDRKLELLETDYRQIATERLTKARDQRDELARQLLQAAGRTPAPHALGAPIGGRVIGLRPDAVGAIIAAHEPVLGVQPPQPRTLIEARVPAPELARVHLDQPARIRLSGTQHTTLNGQVIGIGTERRLGQDSTQPYHIVQIAPEEATAELSATHSVAEVHLQGERRTPLQSLLERCCRR